MEKTLKHGTNFTKSWENQNNMRTLYKLPCLILILLFLSLVLGADTHEAASASYADVNYTVNTEASAGDTVIVPAGTETWTESTLMITKELTLQGSGIGQTIITGSFADYLDAIIEVALSSDVPVRITGFEFRYTTNNPGAKSVYINGRVDGSFAYTQIRVDHNKFVKGTRSLYIRGWVYGVADNNQFLNNNISVGLTGDDNYSWGRAIAAGTANAFFIEDNIFTANNDADREPNDHIYHQQGARSVTRYNTFDGTALTDGRSFIWFDTHGNQNYYTGSGDFRGQPILEVYENTVHAYYHFNAYLAGLRGGSILFYNNSLTLDTGTAPRIRVTDEESWSTAFFDPLDDTWPAEDQINNCFFWGNTANGNPITALTIQHANDVEFIVEDRDYFMHAPESSGGYEYYDDRPGAAGNGDPYDGTLVWDGDHANAYYPYTPYTYPHPLRSGPSGEGPFASDLVMILGSQIVLWILLPLLLSFALLEGYVIYRMRLILHDHNRRLRFFERGDNFKHKYLERPR